MTRLVGLWLVALLVAQSGAAASPAATGGGANGQPQDARPAEQPASPVAQDSATAPPVDPSKMGIDLSRIRRELTEAQAEDGAADGPLRLRFTVQVVGIAPKVDFLEGFNASGPVPYGPPTHDEVLQVLTPQEFRTPVVPLYGLVAAAAQKLWDYNQRKRCEAELEEYRRLVMQGVAVAAPRCAQ